MPASTEINGTIKVKIDPRIRQRRNDVARIQARKRLYVIVGVIVVIVGYALVRSVMGSSLFSVRKFDVAPSAHYSGSALISQANIALGTPISQVNVRQAEVRLDSFPWNLHARVVKHWPNTISISVTQRVGIAVVPSTSSQELLVDGTGRVLTPEAITSSNAEPLLCSLGAITTARSLQSESACGVESVGAGSYLPVKYHQVLLIASRIHQLTALKISELAVGTNGELDAKLSSGMVVRLGDASQLRAKFRAVALVLAQGSTKGYSAIDVRVPTEPVLSKW